MTLALIAFTRRGGGLAAALRDGLGAAGESCTLALPERFAKDLNAQAYESLNAWTEAAFQTADALLFVGACGIAVRAIAPLVRDKFTDPAVVAVDEAGAWAVPLLSGHVGGANALARRVADLTGGRAAISTATDVNHCFAVDRWSSCKGLYLDDRTTAKQISAALLDGDTVGLASDFPLRGELPNGLAYGPHSLGLCVTISEENSPFPRTLHLIPPILHLGIGCRRGTSAGAIGAAVEAALSAHRLSRRAVKEVDTIDLKADEPGLLAYCGAQGWPLVCHSAQALAAVEGDFSPSAFVAATTGVDNVCERAAALGGGRLLVKKQAGNGVTVAIAAEAYTLCFEEESQ